MRRLVTVVAVLLCAAPASAAAQADPDPQEFTPEGYRFCGWRDLENGGWEMEWDERLSGAYLVLFARNMTCHAARRNYTRTRYTQTPPYRPVRMGYTCRPLDSDYEYEDVRCTKRGRPGTSYRWQTGS